ncbi:aldehyde dehydrogenase family protein [Methylopila sp. M107]|uniref:aldehyde dehydrogenase family protein n=1 Tax=Methylopila sp. M107 TaxID=1101190 RepID=UPI00035EAC04|nr:aldehyde dehydrogenase family protein [Methylopila sp. M107]
MRLPGNNLDSISPAARAVLDRGAALFVGGEAIPSATGAEIPVYDPSSARQISVLADGGAEDVDQAVAAAAAAFPRWRATAPAERERLLWRWAALIEQNADLLAEIETIDVGMPLWMSRRMEMGATLGAIRYMAGWPTKIAGQTVDVGVPIPGSQFVGYTVREPVGVVAAIIPWNVPMMMAAWKIAPAVAAGCTIVVKPSEVAGLSVLVLADLARQAGFPDGVINVVTGKGSVVGQALVRHKDVAKVTFTGSTTTGVAIATAAAASAKKVTLELGGKSPQILFADADLNSAIDGICNGIFLHSGQICVAGSRLYVERPALDEVVEKLRAWADSRVVGPGLVPDTQIGPVVSDTQKAKILGYLSGAGQEGADIVTADPDVDGDGYYLRPTVVANATPSMQVVREEVFGPVLTVAAFDDADEAVALANDTDYGLSACVWTSNLATAHRIIPQIRSGKVAVNTDPLPYPALPEGGRRASGYGRDLGQEGLDGFLETKSVLIRTA